MGIENLPECGKSLLEFACIKLLVSVEVHSAENHLESAEADTSPLLDCKLEFEVQLTNHHVFVHTVEGHPNQK